MKILNPVFVIVFACLFFNHHAFACSCSALPPIYESYQNADAVFTGKVVASNEPKEKDKYEGGDIFFDIEVVENFKGAKSRQIKLNRGSMGSSCYSGYSIGETYLFYASEQADFGFFEDKNKGKNVVYQGSFCNHTSSLRSAQDQIYFIREMLKGKPEPQIYGSVARSDSDPKTFDWRHNYLEGIKIVLDSGQKKFQATTNKDGVFRFDNIPEGEYTLEPALDEIYKVYYPAAESFQIFPDKTIVSRQGYGGSPYKSFYAGFSLGWNNRIDGNVVDSNGKPIDRYVIKLLPLSKANDQMTPQNLKDSPDHHIKGSFVFGGETPNRYVLAVEVFTPSQATEKNDFFIQTMKPSLKLRFLR